MNPYIVNRANYDLSILEKEIRKRPEHKWIEENLPLPRCVDAEVASMDSFNDLGAFLGKYDLNLLTQLVAFKAMSVSPANFNDFLVYLDQTIAYFSCIFSANLDTINNKSPSSKSFDWGAFLLSIPFDFLKAYGIGLFKLLEKIALFIIKRIFLEILDVIDCDKINKCVIPCDPSQNPYQKLFVKPIIKESTETLVFFGKKLIEAQAQDKKIEISDKEMREYGRKAISRLLPDELECLLRGFRSTKVVQFLIDLFKEHTGHDISSKVVNTIFENINYVVDLIPFTPDTIENNPCGLISIEGIARARLRQQGFTEEQINQKMNFAIQESRGKLDTIVQFLQQLPGEEIDLDQATAYDEDGNPIYDENGNPQINGNSPIVTAVINSSLHLIFDSLNVNQHASQLILNRILVNTLGELCLAYYWTNWGHAGTHVPPELVPMSLPVGQGVDPDEDLPGQQNNNAPEEESSVIIGDIFIPYPFPDSNPVFTPLKEKIVQQLEPFPDNSFLIDFILNGSTDERFYTKYDLDTKGKFSGYKVDYKENGNISILKNNRQFFSLQGIAFRDLLNNVSVTLSDLRVSPEYVLNTNRNNVDSLFKLYNSEKLVPFIDNSIKDIEKIFETIYEDALVYMEDTQPKEFFFQEFFEVTNPLMKKIFSQLDYLNTSVIIERIKDEIDA